MPSAKNVESVAELREKLGRSKVVIAADFTGLDVAMLTALRRKVKEGGGEFLVVKDSVTRLAAAEVGKQGLDATLKGPTALVLGYGDEVTCARVLDEHLKSTRVNLVIRGGVLGARAMTKQDVEMLASLPSQKVLIARLAGQMLASLSMLVGVLNGPARGLATVLQRSADKQDAPAAVAAPDAPEASA